MASLSISPADHVKIRSSWADVMALNHFKDQNFVHSLFSNLVASNASVKQLFAKQQDLDEQEQLFTELFKFTMIYLDKVDILEECMDKFIAENPSLVKFGSSYLEPMGAALIKTLREALGPQKFHSGLETLWIKVYIYIANSILQNDVSDAESVNSAKSKASDAEVQPLSYKSFSSPMPAFSSPVKAANTINIDLQSNDKYRGFRRSVNETTANVQVAVPDSLSTPEPVITPRSHRRNTSAQLQELGWGMESMRSSPSLASAESFDPRRKSAHKRTPSDMSLGMESAERKVSTSSCESPISDVEDTYNLEDEIDFSSAALHEARPSVFDSNSFGIKGLAPIAESESDDEKSNYSTGNASSKYNSTEDREYESSSRTSSLSLHNSDYKSSISSGSGQSRYMDKTSREKTLPLSPQFPPVSQFTAPQFSSPYVHKGYSSSVPSLSSKSSGQRASLGFMRSSYILKKEMNDFGCNLPENVVAAIDQHEARSSTAKSMINAPTSQSLYSARTEKTTKPYSLKYSEYSAPSTPVANSSKADAKSDKSDYSASMQKKEKSSFRKKLGSFFGSSSSSVSSKTSASAMPRKRISSPIGVSSSSNQALVKTPTRDTHSIAPSMYSSNCISSADIRASKNAFQPVTHVSSGYSASIYSRQLHDDASAYTRDSSRRSIFRQKNTKEEDKKTNKYLVKKVPYKTIYLKDIIA